MELIQILLLSASFQIKSFLFFTDEYRRTDSWISFIFVDEKKERLILNVNEEAMALFFMEKAKRSGCAAHFKQNATLTVLQSWLAFPWGQDIHGASLRGPLEVGPLG